jgi:hypothetical protein
MSDKQAVVLIHGIGEQRPMQTLRGFVRSVWAESDDLKHRFATPGLWSKPDDVSASFELRRLTTSKSRSGLRTDFFEFYWAHMMQGTTVGDVVAWARVLLLRWPWRVPRPLLGIWLLLLLALVLAALFAINAALPDDAKLVALPAWLSLAIGIGVLPLLERVLRKVVGDAARYLNPAPANIDSRHRIRSAGLTLLANLHERDYERIVIVGHSLGSVIGYDILTHAWARLHDEHGSPAKPQHAALERCEALAAAQPFDPEPYRAAQPDLAQELRANGNPWRVTDFVTLGSPLAYAAILLAQDEEELRVRQDDRELPTCPPVLEDERVDGKDHRRFSYRKRIEIADRRDRFIRVPHHAAVFAPVRWTNLFFPPRRTLWGDLISGALAPVFGPGIRDVPLSTGQRGGLLSHTLYWRLPKGPAAAPHVRALRNSLALG